MSQLLTVLCSELARVCNRMSDHWSWTRLCCKCERVYARYGYCTCKIPTDPADPLEAFDGTNVEENVMGFVVYILWLKGQPNSFEKYLLVRERRFDLWRDCMYKIWRL